ALWQSRSHASDHFFALPHAPREFEREHVQHDEPHAERKEWPALAKLRRDEPQAGEHHRGEGDHESRALLRGATRLYTRSYDNRDAPRRDQVQERQHEERVEEFR